MTWLGISGIANVLCCIKMAKYYELTENDVVGTVLAFSQILLIIPFHPHIHRIL